MALLRLFLALMLTTGWILVLDKPHPVGDASLPPPGRFLSPQHGFWCNAEPIRPSLQRIELTSARLHEPLTLIIDRESVPRIYAGHPEDAAYAQGYVTAMLRLFQMDMSTRSPIGRLSEIVGERTLAHDLEQRRKGLYEAAERLAASWEKDPESGPLLRAYVAGINDRIRQMTPSEWPVEYKLLDFSPEPWTSVHCAAFYLAMSETLALTAHDIPLTNALKVFGQETFALLYPDRNPYDDPVIPSSPDSVVHGPDSSGLPGHTWGYEFLTPTSLPGTGSNNWAVSAARTLNGHPILCNDPHLTLTLPSIWLEMQISIGQQHAYGVAFTAIPGIAIGFNGDIAWGFTNAGHDVLDWYEIQWTDEGRTRYLVDGFEKEAVLREEVIRVKGRDLPVRDTVRFTVWGPVPQLEDKDGKGVSLAMHWLPANSLDPLMPSVFTRINSASRLEDWLSTLHRYNAPMQNGIFASRAGDIAIRVSGSMPIRGPADGRTVQPGTDSRYQWQGFVPAEENPLVLNPAQGYVASANQWSTSSDFPYPYTGIFEDWRGRYINEVLRPSRGLTLENMMALQNDNTSILAREATRILALRADTVRFAPPELEAYRQLMSWDHRFDARDRTPVLFDLWIKQLDSLAWDEWYARKDSLPLEIPETWRMLDLMVAEPDLSWWDHARTPVKESATDIVTWALQQAVARLEALESNTRLTWGQYRKTTIRHLARIEAFSVPDLELGGHSSALNAMTATKGPSWRMVVELGPVVKAYGIYPGGQSGNPGSPYYRDFLPLWQKGEYRSLRIYPEPKDIPGQQLHFITFQSQ